MAFSKDSNPSRRAWLAISTILLIVFYIVLFVLSRIPKILGIRLMSLLGNELTTAAITQRK